MTDVVVDRLRIRGADGRRLATVAARSLPAALEAALGDLEDGRLDTLTVRLDLDPADYDDATLAVLWADRIRAAALAAGARTRRPGSAAGHAAVGRAAAGDHADLLAAVSAGPWSAGPDVDLVAIALGWLAAGARASALPVALAALAEPGVAVVVAGLLGTERTDLLTRALRRAALRRPARPDDGQPGPDRTGATAPGPAGPPDTADGARRPDRATGTRATRPRASGDPATRLAEAAGALRPLLELAADGAVTDGGLADLSAATRVAGLVLLYPWLADLCREAETWHPRVDPVLVRRIALAALADPTDPGLADDPLVHFLAGAEPDAPSSSAWAPLEAMAQVTDAADAALTRFAALLPGFERSSPRFVRTSWVLRPGLLDADQDPARLIAETAPLDVLLALLPYPVGLLRLPWTPPLSVRFVP